MSSQDQRRSHLLMPNAAAIILVMVAIDLGYALAHAMHAAAVKSFLSDAGSV